MNESKIILYGGLYNNKSINKIFKLFKKSNGVFFDFDVKKPCYVTIRKLIEYLYWDNIIIILNTMNTISREDYRWVSKDLIELRSAIQKLIITSQHDLFTCQLKREINLLDNNGIDFAYKNYDADPSSYYICSSASYPIIDKENVILDDRKPGIGLQIHRALSPVDKQKDILLLK